VTTDGIARVRLHGACTHCAMSHMTMKAGVEDAIKRAVPQIKAVEAVDLGAVIQER
jgi:Fe-S cluster biogenesis protein NfuA